MDPSQVGDFLVGVVAHGHNEVIVVRHVIEPARGKVRESDAVAAGNIYGACGDAVRGVRTRGGRRDFADLVPECGGQLGPGAVPGADEEDAAGSVFGAGSQPFQRSCGKTDVAAALIRFRTAAHHQARAFQCAQMVGQEV